MDMRHPWVPFMFAAFSLYIRLLLASHQLTPKIKSKIPNLSVSSWHVYFFSMNKADYFQLQCHYFVHVLNSNMACICNSSISCRFGSSCGRFFFFLINYWSIHHRKTITCNFMVVWRDIYITWLIWSHNLRYAWNNGTLTSLLPYAWPISCKYALGVYVIPHNPIVLHLDWSASRASHISVSKRQMPGVAASRTLSYVCALPSALDYFIIWYFTMRHKKQ